MNSSIYSPAEDSQLFAEFLKNKISNLSKEEKQNLKLLDMGAGSGILAETALNYGLKNVLAADINPEAVNHTKKKGIQTIRSNLFEKIKEKFDIITFNAPYLPEDKREPKDSQLATTGGKRGDEIPLKFLKQAKRHLNKDGEIYLLISSLTPQEKIKTFNPKIVVKKKIFMEELLILEIS